MKRYVNEKRKRNVNHSSEEPKLACGTVQWDRTDMNCRIKLENKQIEKKRDKGKKFLTNILHVLNNFIVEKQGDFLPHIKLKVRYLIVAGPFNL